MKTMRAVAYARYSSDKQQESSIVVQLAEIKRFCQQHGLEIVHEYVDEAQTGTNSNRRNFQQMVKDATNGEFQFVVVHRMDRWARNVDDARYYKKYFANHGVKVVSSIEEFDETPEGEFFELMSMGMAELYSKKLSREAIAGKMANARCGKIYGGTPLLGYKVQGKFYVIDAKEAEAVRVLFRMFVDGYSYVEIRDYLNNKGFTHSDGRPFTAHFTDILRNRRYIGEYIYNQSAYRARNTRYNNHAKKSESAIVRIADGMPRIIDDETFYKAQAILDNRRQRNAKCGRERARYMLSGVVRCNVCGRSFSCTHTSVHRVPNRVYRCGTRGSECTVKMLSAPLLERYTVKTLYALLCKENRAFLSELVNACYIRSFDEYVKDIARRRDKLAEISSQISNLAVGNASACSSSWFTNEAIRTLTDEKEQEEHDLNIAVEQLNLLQAPNYRRITKCAEELFRLADDGENIVNIQNALRRLNVSINVDNEKILLDVDLNAFVGGVLPVRFALCENRDNIAFVGNNEWLKYDIATLGKRIQDGLPHIGK